MRDDARFAACLPFILKAEGGNDDDPHDHGGRTSRGVIQREYDKYREENGEPTRDVWTASDAEIADIYEHKYWMPLCPTMVPGVDLLHFNMCVNGGPGRAAKILQGALGVEVDGAIGPVTLAALAAADPTHLVKAYSDHCRSFYRSLAQFPRYGRGWMSRTDTMEQAALTMAGDPSGPIVA
jgi:lysozyme family protein